MPRIPKALQLAVQARAAGACEYCRFPEAISEVRYVCDHVIAKQHAGATTLENLAWCCPFCNYHKGPNLYGIDPLTSTAAPLFNPRTDAWEQHFRWAGLLIDGLTATGRATIATLQMNHPDQIDARVAVTRDS